MRVVPPSTSRLAGQALAVVMAIELSRRHPPSGDEWATTAWAAVAPGIEEAVAIRPGAAGTIVAVLPMERSDSLEQAGELALALRDRACRGGAGGAELRGGIAIGVIDAASRGGSAERCAERLSLAAAPGQWLVCEEAARGLADRYELRPVGLVPRWPMPTAVGRRALVARLEPAALPSAVNGTPPTLILGRDNERHRLMAELARVATGRRRVVLVTAPAGGGKSYLLRRVIADSGLRLAAGTAFPPLGSGALDPLYALLSALGVAADGDRGEQVGDALATAATRCAQREPVVIVVDDVHWASQYAVSELVGAVARSEQEVPLAWILSTRTAALRGLGGLCEVADATVELPPLEPADRKRLLAQRLGAVPGTVGLHVARGAERGNPLYLEHLAEAIREGHAADELPMTLHEAVLARLDGLVERARRLARWSTWSVDPRRELEALEREVGDWLDRLETTDVADRATIGRYLARLRAVDVELVIARSVLGMPLAANRRLARAIERLAAASTDTLLSYLQAVARDGREVQAVHEAREAADRAERALRLADADRLLAFVSRHAPNTGLAIRRGDVALMLGRPRDALEAYREAAADPDREAEAQRRTARAEALLGHVQEADARLEALLRRTTLDPSVADSVALDRARLLGQRPPTTRCHPTPDVARRVLRTRAWSRIDDATAAREAIRSLVLDGEPAACSAQLIETAALAHLAGLEVSGLDAAANAAVDGLSNPHAVTLFNTTDIEEGRRTFLHWAE